MRTYTDVEEKARRVGTEAVEEAIRAIKEPKHELGGITMSNQIKDVAEAQAIAQEFAEKHSIQPNHPMDVARAWFNGGDICEAWRETLTVENLNSRLASAFLARKV